LPSFIYELKVKALLGIQKAPEKNLEPEQEKSNF